MYSPAAHISRELLAYIGVAVVVFFLLNPRAQAGQTTRNSDTLCATAITLAERRHKIPRQLLAAIASVESGRWDKETQANIAWPWTVTAESEGKFYPSRQAAIRAVGALQQRGIRNIDVGCMQINLAYHPDAFPSIQEAFDPTANVAYAANFLNRLYKQKGNWSKAVKFYHSSNPKRQRHYGAKVSKARRDIRSRNTKTTRKTLVARVDPRGKTANSDTVRDPVSKKRSYRNSSFASWPPRNYRAQRRLENRARNWAFSKKRKR